MNNLCRSYVKEINGKFKHIQIIFYGSNIYNESSSDLDLCLILPNEVSQETKKNLIDITKKFQIKKALRIDEEIPFENKLIYTKQEVNDIFLNSPFRDEKGNYVYHEIEKTNSFLNSPEMKKRLMLNILTTDHKSCGNVIDMKTSEEKAWFEILTMVYKVFNTNLHDIDKTLDNLYVNPKTFMAGEMYLGYKLANPKKKKHLRKKVKKYSKELIKVLT